MGRDRRWVALALAAVLAACGGGSNEEQEAGAPVTAAPATPAAAPVAAAPQAATLAARTATPDSASLGESAHPEEAVLRETFAYAGGARDPFLSLLNAKNTGPELADLQLVGIYQDVRSNANSVAILREKKDGKRHKLRTGDQIGRLRVAQIRAKEVVFTIEDFGFERQETLSLRKQEDVTP